MATITTSQFLDGGTARTVGEAMAIGSGATLTIRTDTRIHANAPASFTGSLGSPTFTGIGGELFVDATAVRWLAYTGGTGNAPAIGTNITQGGVSGYYLGCWNTTIGSAPIAVGAAIPAAGYIKLREVTGGAYSAGVLGGIAATASDADTTGWIEIDWDAAVNFTVGRIGKIKTRGGWFPIGTTDGLVGQSIPIPTTSSTNANIFCPGAWVEKYDGAHEALGEVDGYEFWAGLSSAANGWVKTALGYAEGYTDPRGKFVKTFTGGNIVFGETSTMTGTYATVAGQASTYAGIALTCTYTWVGGIIEVNTSATAHLFNDGQTVYLDFTSGSGTPDGQYVVTVIDAYNFSVVLAGSGTGGNLTCRPGVTVTFTTHGTIEGESIYADFTTGTGVDGTYQIYAVTGANTYNIAYPHAAALTGGSVTANHTLQVTMTAHGMAVGNEVYMDFTAGAGVDGRYVMKAVAANTWNINYPFATAITSSACTARWTIGYVPAAGLRVKIPNIIWAECATASRQTTAIPNATIASRPEFTTTTAGAIDLESLYFLSGRSIFAQAYSVRLYNCAVSEALQITECATPLDVNNVGVGQYSAQDARALQLTSNFAGGTLSNIWAFRALLGTTDHASEILACNGQTINNLNTGIINYARSSGYSPIVTSQNITINGLNIFNSYVPISTSVNIIINNLDYNDRFIGRTNATSGLYCVGVAAGCDKITLNGVTFGCGGLVEDCHPYNGVMTSNSATNIKVRNVGANNAYLKTGIWGPNLYGMSVGFVSAGNNNTIKLQKHFYGKLRTGLITTINSDKNIEVEQMLSQYPWVHSAKAARPTNTAWLNNTVKGMNTGIEPTTAQTSVYGTHFLDLFRGTSFGSIVLAMNEPTAETASFWSNPAGVAKFNSAGGIEMRAIGAEAIWEVPYFAQGHTGFQNVNPVMSGGTIGNYTLTYQIDKGSGWNGSWNTLNGATLAAETGIDPAVGFKLKVRIITGVTNSTAITFLRIYTTTTLTAQNAINYPLDQTITTLSANADLTGAEIRIYDIDNAPAGSLGTELAGVESLSGTFSFKSSSANSVWIQIIQSGYIEYGQQFTVPNIDNTLSVILSQELNS